MVSKRYHLAGIIIICAMMGIFGCVDQDAPYVSSGNPVKVHTRTLIATDKFLYAIWGSLFCFDWEGNPIWESQNLESVSMVLCGDAFFVDAYNISKDTGTVALLDQEGHILRQRETGLTGLTGLT